MGAAALFSLLNPPALCLLNENPVAIQSFPKGSIIAMMSHATPSKTIRYSTVQVSETEHIELNSE